MAGRFHKAHGVTIGVDNSWATHIDLLQQFSRGSVNLSSPSQGDMTRDELIKDVGQCIRSITIEVDEQLQRMSRFENSISLSTSLATYASTYSVSKQVRLDSVVISLTLYIKIFHL